MQSKDKIEFYDGDSLIATVNSSMPPPVGSKISIRTKTWVVVSVSYALDHADERAERSMRANVDLEAC